MQSEQFKAVADLASGVAHNFNNLLQIVMGTTELALKDLAHGRIAEVNRALIEMREACIFGAETVKRLQGFANMHLLEKADNAKVFDLSDIAGRAFEMTKLLWKDVPEKAGIAVSMSLDLEKGCLVKGKANEMFEVAVNLIKNALGGIA